MPTQIGPFAALAFFLTFALRAAYQESAFSQKITECAPKSHYLPTGAACCAFLFCQSNLPPSPPLVPHPYPLCVLVGSPLVQSAFGRQALFDKLKALLSYAMI